ncbi:Hypothetical protein, putative [Bodo saltans]|uniref:VWFA domain-containing protein n=1 Tax=Bodo saltans TaxID=75058 RepID=A0A0S4JXJ1_BODSA|nr:Hypothetical protein, putative [Bodo saltans]|eukprot:CUG94152.1 Hypothetical protein, putative [Bodo saltans]
MVKALQRAFPTPVDTCVHNIAFMLSDCFSQETNLENLVVLLRNHAVNMCCLNVGNETDEGVKRLLESVTGRHVRGGGTPQSALNRHTPCYRYATLSELGHDENYLLERVGGLLNEQMSNEITAINNESSNLPSRRAEDSAVRAELPPRIVPATTRRRLPIDFKTLLANESKSNSIWFERNATGIEVQEFEWRRERFSESAIEAGISNTLKRSLETPLSASIHYQAQVDLHNVIEKTRSELEGKFSENRFTRLQPSTRGSKIHMPSLIRSIGSGFTDLRFFANLRAGPVRAYSALILLDVSVSMGGGNSFLNSIGVTLSLALGLRRAGIDRVGVLLFGSGVQIVKLPRMQWSDAMVELICCAECSQTESDAAEAIHIGAYLLKNEIHAHRQMFVVTDGHHSSSPQDMANALKFAARSSVEVTAISCGNSSVGCHRVYKQYIVMQHVSQLPEGLASFFGHSTAVPFTTDDAITPTSAIVPAGENEALMMLLEKVEHQTYHETEVFEVTRKENVIDVVISLDVTMSMKPMLPGIKDFIYNVIATIRVKMPSFKIRVGIVPFRDHGDAVPDVLPLEDLSEEEQEDNTETSEERVSSFLDDLEGEGGGDQAEDVVGGLKRAVNEFHRSITSKRIILHLSDAPQHGRSNHPIGCPITDDHADSNQDSLKEVLDEMESRRIILVVPSIGHLTTQFHREVERLAPQRDGLSNVIVGQENDFQLYSEEDLNEARRVDKYFFIISIDCSGSMGEKDPNGNSRLDGAKKAAEALMTTRRALNHQTGNGFDRISISFFNHECKTVVEGKQMGTAKDYDYVIQAIQGITCGGLTSIANSLGWCLGQVQAAPSGYQPVVILITDGCDQANSSSGVSQVDLVRQISFPKVDGVSAEFYGFLVFTTSATDINHIKKLVDEAHVHNANSRLAGAAPTNTDGSCFAPTAEDIAMKLTAIAQCPAPVAERVVDAVGTRLADTVVQAISSRCL